MFLYQPKEGYCYNSDTHFLYDFIVKNMASFKNIKGELLDIGSGSGILGLLVANKYKKLNLNQCEKQEVFQFLTKKNSQVNGIESNLFQGDFTKIDFGKSFDMIVSNPPFYHQNHIKSDNENIKIARYSDSMPLDILIEKSSLLLNKGGKFFFCYDVKQINDIILLLKKSDLNIESIRFVHPKIDKDATLAMIYARKGSKSMTKIVSPLIMFEEGEFTAEVKEIYKQTSTHSIKCEP